MADAAVHAVQPTDAKKGINLSAAAIYVQPNNIGQVAVITSPTINPLGLSSTVKSFTPEWSPGYRLMAGYNFGTNNDIDLNWTHFNNQTNHTLSSGSGQILGAFYIQNDLLSNQIVNNIATNLDTTFNSVKLEFSRTFQSSERIHARPHIGLEYAHLHQILEQKGWYNSDTAVYDNNNIAGNFSGVGPRFGIDTIYNFGNGLAIFGNIAGSFLLGNETVQNTESYTAGNGSGRVVLEQSTSSSRNTSSIPAASAKLGLQYTKLLNTSSLSAEAGFEVTQYWDAVSITTLSQSSFVERGVFEYNGAFLGLKWLANA